MDPPINIIIQFQTEPYQYIRIKNLGENHYIYETQYYLVLTNFEIFGAISENSS